MGARDDTIGTCLRRFLDSPQRLGERERFVGAFDGRHTLAAEDGLRRLHAPTLVARETDDGYSPQQWSHWRTQAIPGVRRRVESEGARIFFHEARAQAFDRELRAQRQAAAAPAAAGVGTAPA
ncbi:hypothetical protein ABU614_09140 [Lysobacter firmicutimachus]|uniref:Uncharacterized protein n=1 Tax=Lysobacter firmicutimachus TaxID=1792846 RepID=A0AAU8MUY8_9GAMM